MAKEDPWTELLLELAEHLLILLGLFGICLVFQLLATLLG